MRTFHIDRDDRIRVLESSQDKNAPEGSIQFRTQEELEELAQKWPASRLVNIWNRMAGASPVRKFSSRQIATARIWKAIQDRPSVTDGARAGRKKAPPAAKSKRALDPGQGSKKDEVIALLSAGTEVTMPRLMEVTGWQRHTIRGFLSTLKKKMALKVSSSKNAAGERVYSVAD